MKKRVGHARAKKFYLQCTFPDPYVLFANTSGHRENIRRKITRKYYYTAGILHPKRSALSFFLISIVAFSRPRTTKTNNFYQPAKCNASRFRELFRDTCMHVYVYRKGNARCPRNFSEYNCRVSVKREQRRKGKIALSKKFK